MEKDFVKVLVRDYNYPKEAVITNIPGKFQQFDVLIQKGNSYIQAFEIKSSMPQDVKREKDILQRLSRSLNEFTVDTPIYFAIFNAKKEWEIYAYDDLENPLDLNSILNYQGASRQFWGLIKDSVDKVPDGLIKVCRNSAIVVGIYFVICILYDMICLRMTPISSAYLFTLCLILVLVLLPYLLQMTDKLKRIKLWLLEIEFLNNKERK